MSQNDIIIIIIMKIVQFSIMKKVQHLMRVHFLGSMMTESLFSSCWADYLVKSGGTGVVTKDCMGFRWTCWNMRRISGLFEISSLLLQE